MKKIILDTNAYTDYLSGSRTILGALSAAETVFMSIFVLGELYAGFRGGSKEAENRKNWWHFSQSQPCAYCRQLRKRQKYSERSRTISNWQARRYQ